MPDKEIAAMQTRLAAWEAVVLTGLPAALAAGAPHTVEQLKREIAYLTAPERADDIIPLSAYERRILLEGTDHAEG